MKKGGGSECTIIIGPSKSVLVYALHRIHPRPYPISGVRVKIIIIIISRSILLYIGQRQSGCSIFSSSSSG